MKSVPVFRVAAALAAALLLATGAAAQPASEAAVDARLAIGPLRLDPRLTIHNVGIDSNVFNSVENPVSDFTATAGPELDTWLRLGRLDWAGTSTALWTYFRDTRSERSLDLGQTGRVTLRLGPVVPFARGGIVRARQRPNVEVDARVQRDTTDVSGGVELQLGTNLRLSVEHGFRDVAFDTTTAGGDALSEAFDRREVTTMARGRLALTPLTTFVIAGEVRADRFARTPDRDTDTVRVLGGLELRPMALISGRGTVGVRRFSPRSGLVSDFTGLAADVELAYQVRDRARLTGVLTRDVDYSFDLSQAYYVSTGARLAFTQAVGGGFDVGGHLASTRLDYRAAVDTAAPRRDDVRAYGLSLGRRFGAEVRLGLDVEYVTRASSVRDRTYEGWRIGGAFSYGF